MLYLSKLATLFITPLGLCLGVIILGLALIGFGRRRTGAGLIALAAVLLWAAAMPVTARLALGTLEQRFPPHAVADTPEADVAIVLGGAIGGAVAPRSMPELGEASDRVFFAAELFRAGKVKAILVTGGNLPWMAQTRPEAEAMKSLLVRWGVPPEAILTAGTSLTTAENAREVAALWPGLGFSSALLVTSAAHMPRAMGVFRKERLPVTAAPADIRVVADPFDVLDLMPDAGALGQTSDAVKEAIGYIVYRARGDI